MILVPAKVRRLYVMYIPVRVEGLVRLTMSRIVCFTLICLGIRIAGDTLIY